MSIVTYTITRDLLADALRRWEEEAAKNDWRPRTDESRHTDNADYLIGLMAEAR